MVTLTFLYVPAAGRNRLDKIRKRAGLSWRELAIRFRDKGFASHEMTLRRWDTCETDIGIGRLRDLNRAILRSRLMNSAKP